MRTCKPPLDGDSGNQSAAGSCFASVGTAAHSYHGDDAVGYGPGYMVVADGVSGTMKASGVLARLLVSETLCSLNKLRKRAREEPMKPADLTAAIQSATKTARRATKRKGRLDSTLTVVYFDEASHQMFVYTIGDCKCVLMRNNKIVFESDSIIYDFNVPAVVSNNKTINYTGEVHIQTCKYEAGDVCMVFSDGVHDNLYVDQVVACVEPCPENAEEIAKKTVQMAKNTFTDCDDYIPFAVSAAGFCREAMAELKTNNNVNPEEYEAFSQKCQNIPAFEITRPMFAKENRVRQLAFYSASNLLAFAHKRQGKRDDVSVCAAVLAYQLAFGSQTPPSRKSNNQERPARAAPAKATRAIMGKRGRKDFRNKSGNFNKKSRQARDDIADAATGGWVDKREDGFSEWVYTNDNFIKYYQAQGVVPEAEWDTFMKFLATPLPTTFRINNSCPFAENIRERIANDFKFDGLVLDDEQIAPIANMPWYPDQKGFQWSVERRKVRKLPILAEFQKWLVELTNSGSTTRQEAVSMIPPLILGVEPHHKVLDMCAAPGSKTSQLLESLHAQEHITGETPTGMVMANDIDLKRAYMLVHQSKRIGSPALLVTCHEAQHIPYVGAPELKSEGFFDRILCDAPCSGDGTLRKNPIIWKQWDAKNGIALHPLQVEISKRGASLLKVGGYMCYSTCTFNPLENEAIVAELLRWSNGALELVDVADRLPLLKRRPGISSWKVMGSGQIEYNSFEHYVAENEKQRGKNKITPTMFPPTAEEAVAFNLDRCMRCVPHDENTGGFFICLFKKTAPTPQEEEPEKRAGKKHRTPTEPKEEGVKTEEEETAEVNTEEETTGVKAEEEEEVVADVEPKDEAATATAAAAVPAASTNTRGPRLNRQERRQLKQKGEEYVALDDAQWKSIQEHFGIVAPFSGAQLFTRSDESKSVTFVTKSITSELIEEMKAKKLKVVYTGLKLFERTESSGSTVYRLCQAGLPHVLPFISKRKITVSKREFQMMLERLGDLMDYDEFEPATQKIFEDAPLGSISCSMENPRSLVEEKIMNIVVWRGRNSVNVMATKADAVVLLSAMKELKLFDAQVSEAVQLAKQKRDAERAQRDLPEAETVEVETVAVAEEKEDATATPIEE